MINLENIRGFSSGQRASFEALICQLASRENQPAGSTFRRVEGSGGDGGVEGYWLLANGNEIGYQPKFFVKSASIDWAQVDKSVQAALTNHPKLVKYVIAIPCNLTDRTGATRRGKTGWEHWDSHSKKWHARSPGPTSSVDDTTTRPP